MEAQKPIPGTFPRQYEVFELQGVIEKNSAESWTYAQACDFTDEFLAFLEQRSLSFGGGIGVPYHEDEENRG